MSWGCQGVPGAGASGKRSSCGWVHISLSLLHYFPCLSRRSCCVGLFGLPSKTVPSWALLQRSGFGPTRVSEQSRRCAFYDAALEVTQHRCHHLLLVTSTLLACLDSRGVSRDPASQWEDSRSHRLGKNNRRSCGMGDILTAILEVEILYT